MVGLVGEGGSVVVITSKLYIVGSKSEKFSCKNESESIEQLKMDQGRDIVCTCLGMSTVPSGTLLGSKIL